MARKVLILVRNDPSTGFITVGIPSRKWVSEMYKVKTVRSSQRNVSLLKCGLKFIREIIKTTL